MKKKLTALMLVIGLGVTGCGNKTQQEATSHGTEDSVVTSITTGIEQDRFHLPYTITKASRDLNGDGELEYIEVILKEGQALENNQYQGNYEVCLTDSEGQVLQSTLVDKQKDIVLTKDFEIVFKDYNEDGILDFNIGYISEEQAYYRFFTLKEDKKLALMGFMDYYWLKSCFVGHSYAFPIVNHQLVNYYNIGRRYYYESYQWEQEGYFGQGEQLVSAISYMAIDREAIERRIRQLKDVINPTMGRRAISDLEDSNIEWFYNSSEEWGIYVFMNELAEEDIPYTDRVRVFYEMGDISTVNRRFLALEDPKNIYTMSLKEFKEIAGDLYHDDYKKHPMFNIEEHTLKSNQEYTLISGIVHLEKFILVYDEQGKYKSGYTWSDNIGEPPVLIYRKKQNAYSVTPVCFGRGTGVSLYGGRWFQIYKGKIVNILDYLVEGYEMLRGDSSSVLYYKKIDDIYKANGDYEVVYEVGIDSVSGEAEVVTEKSIVFKWSDEEQTFNMKSEEIYDILYNQLFYPGIIDALYKDNKKMLTRIMKNNVLYKLKKDLVLFLIEGQRSTERDELLNMLKKWYENQEGKEYNELILKMDKALKK